MPTYTITLTEEEAKALLTDVACIEDWLDNAVKTKVTNCVNKVVVASSNLNPSKLTAAEKLSIVKSADVVSAKERTEATLAKLGMR